MEKGSHSIQQMIRADEFYQLMKVRRSVRRFSQETVDLEVLKLCVMTAGTAPSGANSQPWFFCIVTNSDVKRKIRCAAEVEEKQFYEVTATKEVLCDLKPFNTDWQKPHLEEAAALIVIFAKSYEYIQQTKRKCYYPKESVGIATGFLISALHTLGIATLTHTPQPMSFLNDLLRRPNYEKPYLILAVGKRHSEYTAPDLKRKTFDDICKII